MAPTQTPARDAVLVKYLNEAYGKEKQLETNLTALIGRAQNHKTLKRGLQDHLKVTKAQARDIERRVKALGGKADGGPDLPGPDAAGAAVGALANVANRAVAASKGPVQMLRGTGEADNMLRNVRDAYWNEGEEIAHYSVIEAVATKLNDSETARLARRFRKEEERMQKFLERQIKALVGEVVKEEVPASERRTGTTRRRASSARSSSSRSSSSRGSSGSSSRKKPAPSRNSSASSRKAAGQKAAATRTRKAAASSAKSTAKSARSTAKKASTTAKKAGSAARSTVKRASS